VGGSGVAVGGSGVAVGGSGVAVGGSGVAVGGWGVAVDGTGVAVGGSGVAVGGSVGDAVGACEADESQAASSKTVTTRPMTSQQNRIVISLLDDSIFSIASIFFITAC